MKTVIVIPAREGSSRFPGKPLAHILGKPLLFRVWKTACSVNNADEVIIATDSQKILEAAEQFGAKVVMTPPECENGTERTFQAIQRMGFKPDLAINLQGDAVLTPPWIVEAVIDEMLQNPGIQIATPAFALQGAQYEHYLATKESGRTSGTTVVFDLNRNALYFSKAVIPHARNNSRNTDSPVYRHIGLYGYRMEALNRYVSLKSTPLENSEKLEQLRALENGIPIKVVPVDYRGRTPWSIDLPEDIGIAEKIIQDEGEII